MHAAAGALTGGLAGAAGATVSSISMPVIAQEISKMDLPDAVKQGLDQIASAALGAAVGSTAGMAASVSVEVNNRQLHPSEYKFAKDNAKLVAKKLNIGETEAEGRIVAEILRNSDKQTADASGGVHDYQVRALLGCQNLNCDGNKNDPQYVNHNFNAQYIPPNQAAYNFGQKQVSMGQTYDQLATNNIKNNPVSTGIAGAGLVAFGLATGTGPATANLMKMGVGVGAAANGAMQLTGDKPFDWMSFGLSGLTGAVSAGQPFIPVVLISTGSALTGSSVQGQNPNGAMVGAAIGSAIGYPLGAKVEGNLDKFLNPWYRQQWKGIGLGISTYVPKNAFPSVLGNAVGGVAQEKFGSDVQTKVEQKK